MSFLQVLILVLITNISQAQELSIIIDRYFKDVRSGRNPLMPHACSDTVHAATIIELLKPYLKDSIPAVKTKAYALTHLAASGSPINRIRQAGVDILIQACANLHPGNLPIVLLYLKEYRRDDYSSASKVILKNLIRQQSAYFDAFLKLAGFLNLTYLTEEIQQYTLPGNASKIRWAAILSLARMGESNAVDEMMNRVLKLPVNDDLVYRIFPDLLYTRQRKAIAYMVEALKSESKECVSADAESETPILCGYRIMEQLAPVIENYPLKLDESGDITRLDYPAALTTVRQWFETHRQYIIRNDTF